MLRRKVSPWLIALLLVVLMVGFGGEAVRAGTSARSADSWGFVIFGDTRGSFDPAKTPPWDVPATGVSPFLPQIATKIVSVNPEFVLHVGDLIAGDVYRDLIDSGFPGAEATDVPYDVQFENFKDAIMPITVAQIPFYAVRGNHEVSCLEGINGHPDPRLAAAYYQAFGQYMPRNRRSVPGRWGRQNPQDLNYSFSHKQVTVVAVDQYSTYVRPNPAPVPWYAPENTTWATNFWGYHTIDQAWVKDELSRATTPFRIVMAHEPIFVASGTPSPANGTNYEWYGELYFGPPCFGGQAHRQQFVDIMGNGGVQLYAVGHQHNLTIGSFTDRAHHTMYQLTAGNGGAMAMNTLPDPPTPEGAFHLLNYELNMPGFTLVTVDPVANTMLLEYYVMDMSDSIWSKEAFTTLIPGPPAH